MRNAYRQSFTTIRSLVQEVSSRSNFQNKHINSCSPIGSFDPRITGDIPHSWKATGGKLHTQEKLNLACCEVDLPGSSLATSEINNDFTGVTERHAYRRIFEETTNFAFYVDAGDYTPIRFFEQWIEYATNSPLSKDARKDLLMPNYFYRMRYPDGDGDGTGRGGYIGKTMRVVKFERNHFQFLEYRFIGMFPLALNSTRVSYQNSQVLKATATFSFDRYVCGESNSLARALGLDLNNKRGRTGNTNIDYNNANSLNDIINPNFGGLSLLNQGTQFANVNGQIFTGTDSTLTNNGATSAYQVLER